MRGPLSNADFCRLVGHRISADRAVMCGRCGGLVPAAWMAARMPRLRYHGGLMSGGATLLLGLFNQTFPTAGRCRDVIRRQIRANLSAAPKGRGNRAWKRAQAEQSHGAIFDGGTFTLHV